MKFVWTGKEYVLIKQVKEVGNKICNQDKKTRETKAISHMRKEKRVGYQKE